MDSSNSLLHVWCDDQDAFAQTKGGADFVNLSEDSIFYRNHFTPVKPDLYITLRINTMITVHAFNTQSCKWWCDSQFYQTRLPRYYQISMGCQILLILGGVVKFHSRCSIFCWALPVQVSAVLPFDGLVAWVAVISAITGTMSICTLNSESLTNYC